MAITNIKIKSAINAGLSIILLLSLQGCLYGIRNKATIPFRAIAVTGAASPFLLGQLQFDILTYIDVKVAIAPKDADLIVEILQDTPNSQIASTTGVGLISGYNLNDAVVFRVFDIAGNELISETQIYTVRDMSFSPSTVLSTDIQEQQFLMDMRKELAMQITIRLMSLGRMQR